MNGTVPCLCSVTAGHCKGSTLPDKPPNPEPPAGLGATLLGLQATVGLLVAKTLTNATANPFLAGGAGSYNPVLALDVFLVQVSAPELCSTGRLPGPTSLQR